MRDRKVDPMPAKAARDYLNVLVTGSTVTIRRIYKDRHGRTVAELSIGPMNIKEVMFFVFKKSADLPLMNLQR